MKFELDIGDTWLSDEGCSLQEFVREEIKNAIRQEIAKVTKNIVKEPQVAKYLDQIRKKMVADAIKRLNNE